MPQTCKVCKNTFNGNGELCPACIKKLSDGSLGDYLAQLVEKASSPGWTKAIAKDIGFNDTPLFGRAKARMRIFSELAIVNTALVIIAVNQAYPTKEAKPIIDLFLAFAHKFTFKEVANKDPGFPKRYEERMAEYHSIYLGHMPSTKLQDVLAQHSLRPPDKETQTLLGVSHAFMANLGINPLQNPEGQIALIGRFGDFLATAIELTRA